jgi:sulfatase maturation enzyme AslB (radical SAM superfamily)
MDNRPIKVRTIIFTDACPLDCRYCDLKNDKEFGKFPTISKEKLLEMIEAFNREDNVEEINTRLLFSGGEPLLYWDWIKEIIEKYQHRF